MIEPAHPLAQLAQLELDRPLIPWIRDTYNDLRSWDKTASALQDATGVRVSRETVRRWAAPTTGNEISA